MEIRAARYPDVISLAQGIPSFDTPLGIKRRVELALKRGVVAKYSLAPGLPELRELIEQELARNNMFYDWSKEILVTAGSIEAITATILALTSPGDEIIVPEPTYASYKEVINLAGCKPVFVSLDEERGWALDMAKITKAITYKTRAIFYCNPNNPTGTLFSEEQILAMGKLAVKHNFFIISDEVYKDFVFGEAPVFSLAQLPQMRRHVVRIFSFSKAYAMTGWRVGYLHSDESVVAEILKVHDTLVTCAPVVSQYAAMGALEMGESDLTRFRREYLGRRNLICRRLDKLKKVFSYVRPDSSYFVFPSFVPLRRSADGQPIASSWDFASELLDKAQVAVVPGIAFGPSGEGHVRLSFGRSEQDINKAFDRLERHFSQ
ncbi:MAG TPA: aminotransferase [Candidatus Portnoybacteria bacterium]|nr:aminotransferase [Candidatus Portnoybacteria bacterium]